SRSASFRGRWVEPFASSRWLGNAQPKASAALRLMNNRHELIQNSDGTNTARARGGRAGSAVRGAALGRFAVHERFHEGALYHAVARHADLRRHRESPRLEQFAGVRQHPHVSADHEAVGRRIEPGNPKIAEHTSAFHRGGNPPMMARRLARDRGVVEQLAGDRFAQVRIAAQPVDRLIRILKIGVRAGAANENHLLESLVGLRIPGDAQERRHPGAGGQHEQPPAGPQVAQHQGPGRLRAHQNRRSRQDVLEPRGQPASRHFDAVELEAILVVGAGDAVGTDDLPSLEVQSQHDELTILESQSRAAGGHEAEQLIAPMLDLDDVLCGVTGHDSRCSRKLMNDCHKKTSQCTLFFGSSVIRRIRLDLRDSAKLHAMEKSNRAGLLGPLMALGVSAVLCGAQSAASAASPSPPKIDLDAFDALKKTVALPDGEVLAYIDMGNRAGPAVVLIHGYTDNARDWAPMLPYVSKQFRLILVDIRGHGRSSKPECCYSRLDFAYDIKLLLDALGVQKADIVGHSLGSIIAQTFAEYWPERTDRVVLISSTGGPPPGAPPQPQPQPQPFDFTAEIHKLKEPIEPDSPFMVAWWSSPSPVDPDFIRRQREDAAAIPLRVWLAVLDQALSADAYAGLRSTLPRLEARTLLIWGSKDPIIEEPMRKTLRDALPNAQVRVFEGLGHNPFWEDPAGVAGVINSFLETRH